MIDEIKKLNANTKEERIAAAKALRALIDSGEVTVPKKQIFTNNHVHTKYSFSPYSPTMSVWLAIKSGLSTVGIIDHDAINGAEEFIETGEILGIATTIGFEIRTSWRETSLCGKRVNNPDQIENAYICAHGIPHQNIEKADVFLREIRKHRAKRNRLMLDKINELVKKLGLALDYDKDVLPLSFDEFGGEVTERHLLFALCKKMIHKYGKGQRIMDVLVDEFDISLSQKQSEYLSDSQNEVYGYDLLNVLKTSFIKDIYIDANECEALPVSQVVNFIKSIGAIASYCYLGDVEESPTGDKKAQKFEDDYLTDVLDESKRIGFDAIAYMPSRNTIPQLKRIMSLGKEYGFMQISGEDINQPRQSFICNQLADPIFSHLIDSTWALVGHEISATADIKKGMFADNSLSLDEKIEKFSCIGREHAIINVFEWSKR